MLHAPTAAIRTNTLSHQARLLRVADAEIDFPPPPESFPSEVPKGILIQAKRVLLILLRTRVCCDRPEMCISVITILTFSPNIFNSSYIGARTIGGKRPLQN